MQITLIDLLKAEHVLVSMEARDAQEAILQLANALIKTGHATLGFAEDVWNREQTFPTGLPTQPLAVAIPHADPDHVNRSALCIGTLNSPVRFAQMGTNGSTFLDARLIFLLAIKEQEKQVEMIRQLVTLIQAGNLLERLAEAKDATEAVALVQETLA